MSLKYLQEAEDTLNLDDHTLYIQLGKQLKQDSFFPTPENKLKRLAIEWMNTRIQDFQNLICNKESIKKIAKEETVLLIAVITDIIAAKWNLTNPATVAALIVRLGISKLCSENLKFNE
ncbi:hypothetical protein KORDIASMS9_01812 [Kordia sp. SMS9]|uniref:hypothetical protein n=1 Tax=Kordia sp. SMS9 TaxID=2282170 RepID=UPI000E0D891B|nr:hypothetical protein [Kordia sp. SMS9]AXG69587.1 hypothetical protein KORDIASMS9_01812 [Kordia sp. SMS9]